MVMARFVLYSLVIIVFYYDSILAANADKRILLTDPDYADNQQLHRDIQVLKSTIQEIKQMDISQSTLIQQQTAEIANVQTKTVEIDNLKTKLQQQTAEIVNLQTKLQQREKAHLDMETKLQQILSSLGGGGYYSHKGRSATPVCVPHDPDLGHVSSAGYFANIYGMEYDDAEFGANMMSQDVPCAVCRAMHKTSVIMVPGKLSCVKGWKMEYKGILASGHYDDAGASSYICMDHSVEVLEGGAKNENGYKLFPVKAFCGSLKCPPYVQNSIFNCVVCSK
ncbi:unnamed protein product [Mytilus edulis]|uniref:Uncharacterized protein n=1 Tax=Mytilus edulis TaxID=6550 RepID=A0A8S3TLA8_MYTED|nr:unnamed protein product [Mytilus edulis]